MHFPTMNRKVHVLTKECNAATFEIVFVCKNVSLNVYFYIMNTIFKEFDFYGGREALSWAAE